MTSSGTEGALASVGLLGCAGLLTVRLRVTVRFGLQGPKDRVQGG